MLIVYNDEGMIPLIEFSFQIWCESFQKILVLKQAEQ